MFAGQTSRRESRNFAPGSPQSRFWEGENEIARGWCRADVAEARGAPDPEQAGVCLPLYSP
jgi:hypothetical protein